MLRNIKSLRLSLVSAQGLANYLGCHLAAIKGDQVIHSVSEPDELTDGEIDLGNDISVQVGAGYAVVCWWSEEEECIHYLPIRKNARQILEDLLPLL